MSEEKDQYITQPTPGQRRLWQLWDAACYRYNGVEDPPDSLEETIASRIVIEYITTLEAEFQVRVGAGEELAAAAERLADGWYCVVCPICQARVDEGEAHYLLLKTGETCPISDLTAALAAWKQSQPAPVAGGPALFGKLGE